MKRVIVGTAGHIDHGKTALVKALTGIDADRLEEEKRRGITIDIGFAHLELPAPGTAAEPLRLGFVDVPGHERFVRNMLAGIGGIDLVLLVVAADESVKPQTREHFDICRLLAVRRGITVLSKSDLVDRETMEVVQLEVEELVRGSFLEGAPVVAVSSATGAGIEALKRELARLASEAEARDSGAAFRLPVDRVFVMKGFGTVVTGTLVSGAIGKDQEVEVFPRGRRLRVRGVQVHGKAAEQAVAGERTALNLAGVAKEELGRGVTLAAPGWFRSTRRVDVELTLLKDARPLADRARAHLHVYTAETVTQVALPQEKKLLPGQTAFAQLRTAEPMLLLPGDRFILRQLSPVVTAGGGIVLDPFPRRKRPAEETRAYLETLSRGGPKEVLLARIARRDTEGISMAELVAETGWLPERMAPFLVELEKTKAVARFGDVFLSATAGEEGQRRLLEAVNAFQEANPLVAGISKQELQERLELRHETFAGLLDRLAQQKKLETTGEQVRAAGRGVVMKDEEAEAKATIERAFAAAGLRVPLLKDVLASLPLDKTRAQKIVTLLLREHTLVKLSEELVFHRKALESLRRSVREYKATSSRIDVPSFKDLVGVTRKYAIPLLEYLDREHVTRRVGDEREIL